MAYINEIIAYMEENIVNISIKEVDELRKPFNISTSKFNRDFKRDTESTPRDYLIRMKIELAHSYKSKDPALAIKEVVLKIGWDLTERQFAELFKVHFGMTFGGKAISAGELLGWMGNTAEMSVDNDFMFSKERRELEEIVLRMVLLTGHYTIRAEGELCKTIIYEMENTSFRLPLFTFEKDLIFRLFFDRNNFGRLDLFMVFSKAGETEQCFVPSDKSSYLDLIYHVATSQEEGLKNDILDSIMNWEEIIEVEEGCVFNDYLQRIYKDINPKIDRNAGVFKHSQANYDSITKQFEEEYAMLLNNIHLSEPELNKYIRAVEEDDEVMIKSTLAVLCGIGEGDVPAQKLDLLLRLVEYPDMQFLEFADYSFCLDEALIAKVIQVIPRESFPQFIYAYYRDYKDMMDGDDEDNDEYLGNLLLSDILDDFY
ncbi:helix-turn-helix domain-containing protein [Chryseobacterium viscerum]|uniref:AraC family transcriptional regulator n=1 Tax=Chryseobacterium viscerum TaxID=1037377 RepID=A0A316W9V1_9FLAO|nr:helix-turn-helix domain-containing protein [Chryseobacterium viscerum]PWN58007.1 AraC family transcriptional regulator [Chryseobacterium viscerum]